MIIVNHSAATITLPTRHKLRPGKNRGVTEAVFRNNEDFIETCDCLEIVQSSLTPRLAHVARSAVSEPPLDLSRITRRGLFIAGRRDLGRIGLAYGLEEADVAVPTEDSENALGLRSLVARAVFKDF